MELNLLQIENLLEILILINIVCRITNSYMLLWRRGFSTEAYSCCNSSSYCSNTRCVKQTENKQSESGTCREYLCNINACKEGAERTDYNLFGQKSAYQRGHNAPIATPQRGKQGCYHAGHLGQHTLGFHTWLHHL